MKCPRLALESEMDGSKLLNLLVVLFLEHYDGIVWGHRMCLKFMGCDVWW